MRMRAFDLVYYKVASGGWKMLDCPARFMRDKREGWWLIVSRCFSASEWRRAGKLMCNDHGAVMVW